MHLLPPAVALRVGAPPSPALTLVENDWTLLVAVVAALAASAFFSTLRLALQHSHPDRILESLPPNESRGRWGRLLDDVEVLASSATVFKIACDITFIVLLLGWRSAARPLEWLDVGACFAIAAPTRLLFTEALPLNVARARGDELLRSFLPAFHWLQLPIRPVVALIEILRKSFLRMLGLRDDSSSTRKIVEGLREVIEESAISGDLNEDQREIIENVMEFRALDAAAVMTPRTEIHAIDLEEGLEGALAVFSEAGHSRVPVYRDSVDTIIGTVTALEITKALADDRQGNPALQDLVRPPLLVPETKPIQELLSEFREHKHKMAIVLDEYGGTAGVVTLSDVIEEIVGDIRDEYGDQAEPMRFLEGGTVEVLAGVHVTEVNEALGLEIPESEDFETLGGFVLSELGHFPKTGETFRHSEVEYAVLEATDRRVLRVAVQRSA